VRHLAELGHAVDVLCCAAYDPSLAGKPVVVGGRPNDVALPNAVLTNGTGSGDPDITRYQGSTADPVDQQTGLLGLSRIRDISLLAVPDEEVLRELGAFDDDEPQDKPPAPDAHSAQAATTAKDSPAHPLVNPGR